MDSDEKKSKKPGEAKEPKQRSGLARLLNFAGERKAFTYLGCALSGISQLLSFGPFVCIWFVARDLIEVAPNCQTPPTSPHTAGPPSPSPPRPSSCTSAR